MGEEGQLRHLHGVLNGERVREETFHGRPHLVVPTVMVREMVLGSGPDDPLAEYLPWAAIEESAAWGLWEGRPSTIWHPTDERGRFVSANGLSKAEGQQIGRLQNAHADKPKLRAETWIDLTRLDEVEGAQEAVEAIRNGETVECSTGYIAFARQQVGTFEGRRYGAVQERILPDHLALLPGGKGKCSAEDGCGLPRLNAAGELVVQAEPKRERVDVETNEESRFARFAANAWAALTGGPSGSDCGCGERGNAEGEDPEEEDTGPKGEGHMNEEERQKIVARLAAHEAVALEEQELEEASDGVLRALAQAHPEEAAEEPESETPEGEEPASEGEGEGEEPEKVTLSAQEAKALRALLERDKREAAKREEDRKSLIAKLAQNERCRVPKEELERMSFGALEGLARSVEPVTYHGAAGPAGGSSEEDGYLARTARARGNGIIAYVPEKKREEG